MRSIGLAALVLLAACGSGDGEGALTADEDRALNEAAAMLDDSQNNLAAIPDEPAAK